ncbi:hypothetical protein SAY87_007833 [Trapa incisa]|uniref:NAC domain-containing protein n=1 Tax=Trapa incisa TaxID=236973 RepID=A0AAN7KL25_9MYRT|nr:hypothetical protein SAY87_007833 [Trapa incisa]
MVRKASASPSAAAAVTGGPMALPTVATAACSAAVVMANSGGSAGPAAAPPRSVTALAPGFRFHPTDEELVIYYLKRKICGKSFRFDVITSVDIYKIEPWELPAKTQMKTRDQEWYFFSALDRKYANGARMNRATEEGYWKATGNDRIVNHDTHAVGLKKTLVFHYGRAPDGKRTNWVMHEYRLVEAELNKCGAGKDPYVLCRVFHKSNMGPPIGHRHAPFVEEEWDDEGSVLPGDVVRDEVAATDASEPEKELVCSKTAALHCTDLPTKTRYLLDVCKSERFNASPGPDNEDNSPPTILRYKRRKGIDLNSKVSDCWKNSAKAPQGPCSSSTTTAATQETDQLSRLSALVEYSLKESLQLKESDSASPSAFDASLLDSSIPQEYRGLISNLQEEVYKVSMDRETLRLEMFSVRTMVNILQSRLEYLTKENDELKKKIQDG